MKIYVNDLHQIMAVHKNDIDKTLKEHDVDDNLFNGWCDTVIKGYCYQENKDGTVSVYPYKDFGLLMSVQQLYEEKEMQVTELQLALAELYEGKV